MSHTSIAGRVLPWLITTALRLLYRVEVRGAEHWQHAGQRVLIVANHMSLLDAPLLAAFLPEAAGFAINTQIAQRWWVRPLLHLVRAYRIDPTNPVAARTLIDELRRGRRIVMFPEGRLSVTGGLMKIYAGPGMIADHANATILPVRIDGTQFSPASPMQGKTRLSLFPKVTLTFLPPSRLDLPQRLRGHPRRQAAAAQLHALMSRMLFDSSPVHDTLMHNLIESMGVYGGRHLIAEDIERKPLSYRRFIAASFVLARALRRLTRRNETRIGLMLPNLTATAISFFAIQTLGRTCVLLNFTAGQAQILAACATTCLDTVLSSRRFIDAAGLDAVSGALHAAGVRLIFLEDLQHDAGWMARLAGLLCAWMPQQALRRHSQAGPDDPAVILFTSGSEGAPKGVVLSSRNILANRYQIASRIDFGAQDTVFNCLPMFHAFGLTGATLLPLLSGARVFFYPSPLHYRIVPELVYDCNATILFGTDTFLAGYARNADPYDFHSLRYVFAGAEKLREDTRRTWSEIFGLRIFEGYGITETAPVLSVNTAMHYRAGTVGQLLPGIDFRLEHMPGIDIGLQLFVRGPNVMLGYMKSDHPGILQPLEDGWYDTGDIVRIDDDGYLTLVGRTRRFAKVAGEMVSLAAVEALIAELWPDAAHAVVSVPDARKGEQLVWFTDSADAGLRAVQTAFRTRGMSPLTLPSRMQRLEQLPRLGSGKTDYVQLGALARITPAAPETQEEHPPRSTPHHAEGTDLR